MEFLQRSEVLEYILNKRLSFLLRQGMLILFFIVLAGFGATYFISVPDTVSGQFELSTANPPKSIVTKTDGRIIHLFVQDKSPVQKDQVVAIMEALADTAEVNQLDQQLKSLDSMQNVNLFANIHHTFIDNYDHLGELQSRFEQFRKAKNELKFALSENAYDAELLIAGRRLKALGAQLENEKNQLIIYQRDFDIADENFRNSQSLFGQNAISKNDLKQAESIKLSKELSLSQLKSQMIVTENSQNDVKDQVIQLDKQLETLKNNFIESFNELKSGIAAWKQEHFLKAPESGVISFAYPLHENETVHMGTTLFYILPSETEIVGNLKLSQSNFGKVKVGELVRMKLDGYNYQEYGILNGVVNSISEIPVDKVYLVQIKFPNGLVTSHRKPIIFKYGLTGTAEIILAKKRLLDKLMLDNFRGII